MVIGIAINLWQPAVSGSGGPPVPAVAQPSITSPAAAATDVSLTPTITSSAFAVTNAGSDTHASSDWQVATDAGFTVIVEQSLADAVNLESWTPSALDPEEVHYVRVRHNGTTLGASPWSAGVMFTTEAASAYDAASEAFFDEMDVEPSTAVKDAVDALVVGLKADDLWDDIDMLAQLPVHDHQAYRLYLNDPTKSVTAVNSPTFTPYLGGAGNGTTSYYNTNISPESATRFLLSGGMFGVWLVAGDETSIAAVAMGSFTANEFDELTVNQISPRSSGNIFGGISGAEQSTYGATASRLGFVAMERSGFAASAAYKNGVSNGTSSVSQTFLSNRTFYTGGQNTNDSFNSGLNNPHAFSVVGRNIGATKQTALYNRLDTFRTAMAALA